MFNQPQKEHHWLQQLVGRWRSESTCIPDPEKPAQTMLSHITCRMLGGLWLIAETQGDSPEGGPWSSIMTVGFDGKKGCYVGTYVASMMTYLWPYEGVVDALGKKLPLNSVGEKMDGSGAIAKYCDTIEIVDKDHWIFTGEVLSDDGTWTNMMMSHNYRVGE